MADLHLEKSQTIYPLLRYTDAPAAIRFLEAAFGMRVHDRIDNPDGSIAHAYDLDAHYLQARAAGAEIVTEPFDTEYGSRDYTARDPEGNAWHFGTYRASLAPAEPAGATAAG